MKVNGIRNQNFGVIPSNLIRYRLAQAASSGRDICPLVKAMKSVCPYKYMSMFEERENVHLVGITEAFEPLLSKGRKLSNKGNEQLAELEKKYNERCLKKAPTLEEIQAHAKDKKRIFEENAENIIYKPRDFITLFEDFKGKKFEDIIDDLTTALTNLKNGQSKSQQTLDSLNSVFPPYK